MVSEKKENSDTIISLKNKWKQKVNKKKSDDAYLQSTGIEPENKSNLDSTQSAKSKWKQKIQKKKSDDTNLQSKSRTSRPFLKQKSKSVDDELKPSSESISKQRTSQSCDELSNHSSIDEEGYSGLSRSKVYQRKLFAKASFVCGVFYTLCTF